MNFPITDSLALQIIKELVESKYGRKVIGNAVPVIVTDFNTIKTGWDGDQEDYAHYAVSLQFMARNGSERLMSDDVTPIIEMDFNQTYDAGTATSFIKCEHIIFKWLNEGDWTAFNMFGYRFTLGASI